MRFIQMKMFKTISHYDSIIQFGCGPSFVLNRAELFEKMIINQGFEFWFRFWLTFCFSPGCYDLNVIRKQWPEMTTYINIGVHNQFLLLSPRQSAEYCLNRVIKPMLIVTPTKNHVKNVKTMALDELQDLVVKSWGLAFGCALCHIFFKWLIAEEMKYNNASYWAIPTQYLNPEFKPGLFELFLVSKWKGDLLSHLGIAELHVPWIMELLSKNINLDEKLLFRDLRNGSVRHDLPYIHKTAEFMREIRNGRKKAIRDVDEELRKRNFNNPNTGTRVLKGKSASKLKLRTTDKGMIGPKLRKYSSEIHTKNVRQCPTCKTFEYNKKFKKCKRCVDENWPRPRYYCSINCQMRHWYKVHHNEHSRQKQLT